MENKNIFAIYKPKGPTSYDLIAKIKKDTGEKKVGHSGTLDPLAEGVLVVGLGRSATKNLSQIVTKEKEYIADIKLGVSSSTDDEEGVEHENTKTRKHESTKTRKHENTKAQKHRITKKDIEEKINDFIGTIDQRPPIYSAIKVNGQRAYKLARRGKSVVLKSRPVQIKSIEILKYKFPDLRLKVICGPGVYIRSLARDIGVSLSSGAYLAGLVRTRVGQFKISQTVGLEYLAKKYLNSQVKILQQGGIAVIPTDTLYGLVGQALNKKTIERIYKVRR